MIYEIFLLDPSNIFSFSQVACHTKAQVYHGLLDFLFLFLIDKRNFINRKKKRHQGAITEKGE